MVTSVFLCSLTRAALMSPGKDETRVCGIEHIYENEKRIRKRRNVLWYVKHSDTSRFFSRF